MPILDLDRVLRRGVLWAGKVTLHQVERAEDVADRLAERIARVLHASALLREAAIPGIGDAYAPVVEKPHEPYGDEHHGEDDHEEDDRAVARLRGAGGHEPYPARFERLGTEAAAHERRGYAVQRKQHRGWKKPEDDAAGGEPSLPKAFAQAGVAGRRGGRAMLRLARPSQAREEAPLAEAHSRH